jgi:hypothetical protein
MDEERINYVMNAIRDFIAQHPDSADTLEGIHSWWIRWPDFADSPFITATALQRLEEQGFLEQKNIGSRVLWRRKRS